MVIKTSYKTKRPSVPKKRPGKFGYIYETVKSGLQEFGYYDQIRKYDPGYYLDKYSYKPRKRIAGLVGQKLHAKKKLRSSRNYQFYQKFSEFQSKHKWYSRYKPSRKSGYVSFSYRRNRRFTGVYYQSNILYT